MDIVLLGIGHTNAHVVRMWKMKPIPGTRLTCVSNFPFATYSGMLPGTLAGLYAPERMEIDLVRLCAANQCRLVVDDVCEVDVADKRLRFTSGRELPWDILSIGVGSVPAGLSDLRVRHEQLASHTCVLPIKPMQTFMPRLESAVASKLQERTMRNSSRALTVAVVGGGVAGCEIAMCLQRWLAEQSLPVQAEFLLCEKGERVAQGLSSKTSALLEKELRRRGIRLQLGGAVSAVTEDHLVLENGEELPCDLVLWATGARAPQLLSSIDLPQDRHGFLKTKSTLQSVESDTIFAVGDSGTINGYVDLPKAGVYAVRQGPVLWENLRRLIANESLTDYRPQHDFLRLMATGDRRAVMAYRGWTTSSRWAWKLKDHIDRKFMRKYQDYRPMQMEAASELRQVPMRCTGCGGKVGGVELERVLRRLPSQRENSDVVVGLDAPDDAAVLDWNRMAATGDQLVTTTDFFAAPLDDPFLCGRIAALNAVSDIYAMGGKPRAALATVVIPAVPAHARETDLELVMRGAVQEFDRTQTLLVGGHTIEGPRLELGFTILGTADRQAIRRKSGLNPGDKLILTKPLGTGVLLADHMRAELPANVFEDLLETMLNSNAVVQHLSPELVTAMTDITGFGLVGHLHEMLVASCVEAKISLSSLPLISHCEHLLARGRESTLAPANRALATAIRYAQGAENVGRRAALFDPQTSGGMLLGTRPANASALLAQLHTAGASAAVEVGEVVSSTGDTAIEVVP